jgi:hypothetical protein
MLTDTVCNLLSKNQLLEFLDLKPKRQYTKEYLLAMLQERLVTDEQEQNRLLEMFPLELAVGPNELEALLGCSRVERKRWVKEGKIPVLAYRDFHVPGHDLTYPVHDRRLIMAISQQQVLNWREEYTAQVLMNKKQGWCKAAEQRRNHRIMRSEFLALWHQQVKEWEQHGSPEIAAALQLAYWTVVASHWAKENHIKFLHGTTRAALYAARRDEWYKWKHEAMYILAQTPYAKLSFYRPDNSHKMALHLCEEHYTSMQKTYYKNKWDYYADFSHEITHCSDCLVHIEQDYYALYFLEITVPYFADLRFAFHLPYPLGKSCFPAPHTLPPVTHIEQDGEFRFGRAVTPYERVVQREKDVRVFLEHALNETRRLFHLDHIRVPVQS